MPPAGDPMPSAAAQSPASDPQGDSDYEQVARCLQNLNLRDDVLTIASITSADTVPLGTDLDPNAYCNKWAASKVSHPDQKRLVQSNLGFRVLDAENIGFSYGAEVLKQPKTYDVRGVEKAVAYFQHMGCGVVVVSKRDTLRDHPFGDGVDVIIADSTDDIMVLKQAQQLNCPVVSRDGFSKHKEDYRLASELRRWAQDMGHLQVRFSWSISGDFMPDFDLPALVVKPSDGVWLCHGCRKAQAHNSPTLSNHVCNHTPTHTYTTCRAFPARGSIQQSWNLSRRNRRTTWTA